MFYDSHIHSTFSADGTSTFEEYAEAIDEGRLLGIGFAEHIDFLPECGSYNFLDPDSYIKEVQVYRDRGYEFYAGCEIDYVKKVEKEIIEHLNKNKYAFTICSVHMIDGISISDRIAIPSIKDKKKLGDIIGKYYEEFKWSLKVREFDVIGHEGVYKRYLDRDISSDVEIRRLINLAEHEIARLCARSGKILEVNSSGLFSPLAETLPNKAFLKLYHSYGGRSVCAGSDAHNARDVARGIGTVYNILKETGFEYVMLPWDREHPVSLQQVFKAGIW